jgi:hypothetical protein
MRYDTASGRRSGSYRRIIIAIALCILSNLIGACPVASQTVQSFRENSFDVAADPDFRSFRDVLARFVATRRSRSPNDFCVLGHVNDDKTKSAWVIWKQGKTIFFWNGKDEKIYMSSRKIALDRDVVSDSGQLNGSTYLVTKTWVADLLAACDSVGVKVHVRK